MSEWKPTGQQRFRTETVGLFGRRQVLVLQIEERGIVTWWSGGFAESEWTNRWRDAQSQDLSVTIGKSIEAAAETQAASTR